MGQGLSIIQRCSTLIVNTRFMINYFLLDEIEQKLFGWIPISQIPVQ